MFGKNVTVDIFGESHGEQIGVVAKNLPNGVKIDLEELRAFCRLRAPGQNEFSTPRKEEDNFEIISGMDENGVLDGATFKAIIKNTNTRSQDYEKTVPRPAHADYPCFVKYGRISTGGGRYSGRLTAPMCILGGIAKQILSSRGIEIDAHVASIHGVEDDSFDWLSNSVSGIHKKPFPVINDEKGEKMKQEILSAKENGNSVGGEIECKIVGLPVGVGDALYDGLDGAIASSVFAIPAVKGIEFGLGFESTKVLGSENNDEFIFDNGKVQTLTNNCGGILGGMSNGMPLIFKVAFKPTPSIFVPQKSVDLKTKENVELSIKGRHDPCIVQRAVAPVISAAAIAVLDLMEEK
ncbi:MAG: chorismate synthase [Clostridia bacterium]|nr:chorismate synthase [Clostridia bacterium]